MRREQCPDCPDGQVWTSKGPTGETCPMCGGEAFIWVRDEDDDALLTHREKGPGES